MLVGIPVPETMETPENHANDIPKTGPQRCGNLTLDGPYEVFRVLLFFGVFLFFPFSLDSKFDGGRKIQSFFLMVLYCMFVS